MWGRYGVSGEGTAHPKPFDGLSRLPYSDRIMVKRRTIEADLPGEDLLLRQQDEYKYEAARACLYVLSLHKRKQRKRHGILEQKAGYLRI